MIISPTLLATWKNCPQSALARVRDKKYSPMGRAGFVGSLAHAAIAYVLEYGMPDDMQMTCRKLIGQGWQLKKGMKEANISPSLLRVIVENEVIPICETVLRLGYEDALTEVRIDAEYGAHTLRGVIDAAVVGEARTVLIDWKTGRLYEDSVTDQLTFYAWLWSLEHGYEPGEGRAVQVTDGELLTVEPPWEVGRIVSEVDAMVEDLESSWGGEAERMPGVHCRWCPVADSCPKARR